MQTSISAPRVALIHATPLAMQPIAEAFARHWPAAQLMNVLDDSLSKDLAAQGVLTPAMTQRFIELGAYVKSTGCVATLFTCSAFGTSIEAAGAHSGLPTWKPNEAMFDEVLDMALAKPGVKAALIATFEPSLAPMREELLALATQRGAQLSVENIYVPQAMQDLAQGQASLHHTKIAAALSQTQQQFDCVMLAQFSMAAAKMTVIPFAKCPVLTSPDCAVLAVKKKLS